MDVENLAKELILKNMTPEQQMAVLDSVRSSVAQAKEVQKRKIGENVDLVVQALKKIETDIRSRFDDVGNAIEKRVSTIKDGRDGSNGKDGRDGKDGRNGRDGAKGDKGERGQDGINGSDGADGVSVSNARIDFDGSLIITLSTGVELNVGEVVSPDLAESIKVITNGGGTSQYVLDTLASLQTQITNLIPSQTGNSGKYLTTNGTALSWASVAGGLTYQGTWNASTNTPTLTSSVGTNGYYYIVATAGSTNLNGITDWQIGDWLMFNGSVWQKIDQSNLVTSVNGQTGAVSLTYTDVNAIGSITSTDGSVTVSTASGVADLSVAVSASTTNVIVLVRNATGATLTKGTAVYINGATGQNTTVTKAQANNDTNSAQTLGLMTADLANNSNGYVTVIGLITNINTSSYTDGQQLYLSPTTAGTLTATKPYAPQHLVYVAVVEHAHPTQGKLFVKVQNGYEMDELHNVSAQSPTSGQTLIYNASTSLWEKANITGTASQVTVTNGAGSIALSLPSTINVNTSGSAATLTTPRAIYGNNFDGSAALTQVIASTYGGTGNGFTKFTGATTAERTYTLPDASSTIVVQGGALGTPSSGTITNLTGTASININGTVGATTASSGAFTTLSATGVTTVQAGTAALPAITTTGDTNTGIFFPAADTIAFSKGGAEAMRIDSSGNVGIGTASPSSVLNVKSSAPIFRLETTGAVSSTGTAYNVIRDSTGIDVFVNGFAGTPNCYQFATTAAAGFMRFMTGAQTEALRINASQNVGIGTASPAVKLDVQADLSANTEIARFSHSTADIGRGAKISLGVSGYPMAQLEGFADSAGNGSLRFYTYTSTTTTEKMRIDSGGFTYINCTSSVASVSSYSNIAFSGLSYFGLSIKTTYASAGSTFAAFINSAGTQQGSIYANATNTVQFLTSSDYRLKENIAPMTGALAKVSALKPVTYNWKSDGSASQGFIAHELQTVVAECVGGEKDAVDADGNPKYQGVDTSFLVATLTAAIQEQQALIQSLTTRITALEAK